MNPEEINYSGQYLNNTEYRIKIKTGADISNAKKDCVCGELFLVTGANGPGLYLCTETSSDTDGTIYKVADLSVQA